MTMRQVAGLFVAALLVVAALPASGGEQRKSGDSAASAAKSPQAAVYLAWVKAVKARDFEAWKKLVPAEAPKEFEAQAKEMGKKPAEMLELLGMMTPDENKITGLKVDSGAAVLSVTGKTKGEPGTSYGTVNMVLESGTWRVGKQSWQVKEK